MQIGQASVFKFMRKNKYLIHSNSKIEMGASIATEPFFWLEMDTPIEKVVRQVMYALNCSKINLPNPKDWSLFNKEYLNAIGLKTKKDLYKSTLSLGVAKINSVLIFTPMTNKENVFVNIPNAQIEIPFDNSNEEIIKVFQEALIRCN